MSEKTSDDEVAYTSHNEKNANQEFKPAFDPEETGRRQSVALNIVENPLKVSRATPSRPSIFLNIFG